MYEDFDPTERDGYKPPPSEKDISRGYVLTLAAVVIIIATIAGLLWCINERNRPTSTDPTEMQGAGQECRPLKNKPEIIPIGNSTTIIPSKTYQMVVSVSYDTIYVRKMIKGHWGKWEVFTNKKCIK